MSRTNSKVTFKRMIMRKLKHAIFSPMSLLAALLLYLMLTSGCEKEETPMKWVDLRYRVDDVYIREAKDPEPLTFLVKSSDPWEVIGNGDWYTISPSKGDAGEIDTVTITLKDNVDLDDRIDTIRIKSDYWIGKEFLLVQKGAAYLEADCENMINQEGDTVSINVFSNQNWSAEVTEGNEWLSILEGATGQHDGKITVMSNMNTGEQRTGTITIYDRHGVAALELKITQEGVLLMPAVPENMKWFAINEQAQQLVIPVETNVEWTVAKENEVDDDWYDFEKTSFSGSDNLIINISENLGTKVRTGVILLQTKAKEGTSPVVKRVKFKQANPLIPEVHEINKTITGDAWGPQGLMPGRYNFYVGAFGNVQLNLFFMWPQSNPYAELRFHIIDKKTKLSTTPWCGDVFPENNNTTKDVNTDQPNVLSFNIEEAVDPDDPTQSWIYTEWLLNDTVIAKATSDGITDAKGTSDTWKIPFSEIKDGGTFLLRAIGGGISFQKWEYIAPIVWGD